MNILYIFAAVFRTAFRSWYNLATYLKNKREQSKWKNHDEVTDIRKMLTDCLVDGDVLPPANEHSWESGLVAGMKDYGLLSYGNSPEQVYLSIKGRTAEKCWALPNWLWKFIFISNSADKAIGLIAINLIVIGLSVGVLGIILVNFG